MKILIKLLFVGFVNLMVFQDCTANAWLNFYGGKIVNFDSAKGFVDYEKDHIVYRVFISGENKTEKIKYIRANPKKTITENAKNVYVKDLKKYVFRQFYTNRLLK